ncbi:putative ABC transport system permease protein [Motilibacter rhizosphaerae]|uniref:Putative ABC transport system permease protein n=1 Tax=Motilibacter rhizosphaerae TaxID=598652 RepID=A0A4Q7NPH2_9ACTN|nr:ABC transporter permease [Motilibacter rhizosphaerae]RZS87205.1 putative ABC transport system permease protein [Motilibacter rhizosphaerae]
MNLRESLRFALRGIAANKLRSALTTLGILIGVAAVIVLVAVGTGSSKAVADQINRLGSNVLTVTASQGGTGGRRATGGFGGFAPGGAGRVSSGSQTRTAELTLDDALALTDEASAPDILSVAPVVSVSSVTATYDGATHSVGSFVGTSPSYLAIDDDSVQKGAPFSEDDYAQRRRVALLGTDVATDLVGGNGFDAVGKTIHLNGAEFEVVGILTDKGTTGPVSGDDRIVAPLPAVQDTLAGYASLSSISVKARSAGAVGNAEAEVADILDGRHHVTAATADYTVRSSSSILSAATSSNRTFTVLLASVAAISLLVGGIGVMNIMLVTVTERTREIGIRKAIGARKGDIVGQFLLEAVLLSILGGLAGVAVGLLGSRFSIVGVHPVVAPYSIALAFGVSVLVGLVFGLYPANRAASLRPIDALRYE